jgi:hypothetical protein
MLTPYQVAYAGIKSKSSRTNRCVTHVAAFASSWTDDITRGLDDTLSQSLVPKALHVEYMDTKRVASPDYDEELAAFYQKKFQGIRFAVIVCSDSDDILPLLKMGNGKVFLVDDESDLIEMMKEMIQHLGYQPTAFTDSRRALAAFCVLMKPLELHLLAEAIDRVLTSSPD